MVQETKWPVGRPSLGEKGLVVRFNIRISQEIDEMLRQAEELWPECTDRADVVRRLIVEGLRANGIERHRGSNG